MATFDKKTTADWEKLAAKEIKKETTAPLIWDTPEGIPVKPLYTLADLEKLEHIDTMPVFRI